MILFRKKNKLSIDVVSQLFTYINFFFKCQERKIKQKQKKIPFKKVEMNFFFIFTFAINFS